MNTYTKTTAVHAAIACMLAIVLAMIIGMVSVNAANECRGIYGDSSEPVDFSVETGSGWLSGQSVKLKQTKGEYRYQTMMNGGMSKHKTKTHYGIYNVTVTEDGAGTCEEFVWNSRTLNIKLDKNKKYHITVTPETDGDVYSRTYTKGFLVGEGWSEASTWEAIRTKHCTYCKYEY